MRSVMSPIVRPRALAGSLVLALGLLGGMPLAPVAGSAVASALAAQDLRYTQTSRMEMGGAMGAMMMAQMGGPTTDTVYLQGTRMRQDSKGMSTITDWSDGQVLILDHDARTWRRTTWEDMTRDAVAENEARMDEIPMEERPSLGMTFRTEETERTETIHGYQARQVVLVLEMGATLPPPGAGEDAMTTRTAMVTELWLSEEFPAWELMAEARNELSGGWTADVMSGMLGRLGPELAEALEDQQDAFQAMEGTPLRIVTRMVQLTGDAEVDVEQVLETEPASAGSLQDQIRARMQGMMGEEAPPLVIMKTVTEIDEVEETELDAALFQLPEGYTEREADPPGL